MVGNSFSLSSALALHRRARSLPREKELSPGVWRQKRPCVRASGTSLGNWLHSWVLPRADEYYPYPPPSLSGTSVPCRMYTHACVLHIDQAEITKLLNSGRSQMPRVRTLPHHGRGSSKGWKEPLLYRLILLWISCLPRLPNLTSAKPGFTFYESGQLRKETWFHIRLEQRSFSVVCGLRRKPGPPISGLCLRLLSVGRWEANQRSWPACSPPGPARPEGDVGVRHPALGCFLRAQWSGHIAHYLIIFRWEMWQAQGQLKRAFVSWSCGSSGREPGSKGKGGEAIPAPDWVAWHRRSKT